MLLQNGPLHVYLSSRLTSAAGRLLLRGDAQVGADEQQGMRPHSSALAHVQHRLSTGDLVKDHDGAGVGRSLLFCLGHPQLAVHRAGVHPDLQQSLSGRSSALSQLPAARALLSVLVWDCPLARQESTHLLHAVLACK